jgi:hypothetical protein
VNLRRLAPLLALPLLLTACGDDGGNEGNVGDAGTTSITTPSETTVGSGTVVGPTEGEAACADLADRYVRRARTMFVTNGTPSDQLVDEVRDRLAEFDQIAATAGCGPEYVTGVCEGLDALTQEGILVIMPLTTAQCL